MKSFKVCKLHKTTTPQRQSLQLHTETKLLETETEEEEEEEEENNDYALVPYTNHLHGNNYRNTNVLRRALQYVFQRSLQDLTNDGARMIVYSLNVTEIVLNYTINYVENNTEKNKYSLQMV